MITVQYETLLKRAAGTASDVVDLTGPCDVPTVIREAAGRRGDSVAPLLLDSSGKVRPSVLIFIDGRQVSANDSRMIRDGDTITLMTPISGG